MKKISFNILLTVQIISYTIFAANDTLFSDTNQDNGFITQIFNVGQGNGISVVDNKNGRMMIVDAGSSCLPGRQPAESLIPTFLAHVPQKLKLSPITIVVSHPDKDHLNWLERILEHDTIKHNKSITIYLGGNFEKYLTASDAKVLLDSLLKFKLNPIEIHSLSHALTVNEMRNLLKQVEQQHNESSKNHGLGYEDVDSAVIQTIRMTAQLVCKIRPFIVRSKIDGFDDLHRVNVEILGANAGHTPHKIYQREEDCQSFIGDVSCSGAEVINSDENTNSIVLRITFYNSGSIIITGDATGISTDRLIRHCSGSRGMGLYCDLLVACHHGSITEESNNPRWVGATQPKWVVFSAGKHAGYHHPQFDSVWNYADSTRIQHAAHHSILCARLDTRDLPNNAIAEARAISIGTTPSSERYNKQKWLDNISCSVGIYSTNSSGTITFYTTANGQMTLKTEQ